MNTYKQGHDKASTSSHERRTAESDAAFLLPHLKLTDHILDIGCGPGTITASLAYHVPQGSIIGVDLSQKVLDRASSLLTTTHPSLPTSGPGSIRFLAGNVLDRLPFPDQTFDVVYTSQTLGHLPLPQTPVMALREIHRLLKPGGILASRDAVELHAYPRTLNLDERFFAPQWKLFQNRSMNEDSVASSMPRLLRAAGFDVDREGSLTMSGGSTIFHTRKDREWFAERTRNQLEKGATNYENWKAAGFDDEKITDAIAAVEEWAAIDDAWYIAVQCECLVRK